MRSLLLADVLNAKRDEKVRELARQEQIFGGKMYKLEDGYRIYARWPKSVSPAFSDWEPWTQVFANTADAKIAHERLTSKGAGKYYDFGLFYLELGKPKRLRRILSKPRSK